MCDCEDEVPLSESFGQPQNCNYNVDQLRGWQKLLICIEPAEIGKTRLDITKALGLIVSAIASKNNLCFFALKLDELQPLIIQALSIQRCS